MQVCSLVTAKKYDYLQIVLFALYLILVIAVFIIEDVYLFKVDSIAETHKMTALLETKEMLCWFEITFVIFFALDMVLHAIGYGLLYLNKMIHLIDIFIFIVYIAL